MTSFPRYLSSGPEHIFWPKILWISDLINKSIPWSIYQSGNPCDVRISCLNTCSTYSGLGKILTILVAAVLLQVYVATGTESYVIAVNDVATCTSIWSTCPWYPILWIWTRILPDREFRTSTRGENIEKSSTKIRRRKISSPTKKSSSSDNEEIFVEAGEEFRI